MLPEVKQAAKQFQAICLHKYELRPKFYEFFAGFGMTKHDDGAIGEFLVGHPEINLSALALSLEDQLKAEAIKKQQEEIEAEQDYQRRLAAAKEKAEQTGKKSRFKVEIDATVSTARKVQLARSETYRVGFVIEAFTEEDAEEIAEEMVKEVELEEGSFNAMRSDFFEVDKNEDGAISVAVSRVGEEEEYETYDYDDFETATQYDSPETTALNEESEASATKSAAQADIAVA